MRFSYESEHLEMGFPGRVLARAIYKIRKENKVEVVYEADVPGEESTPINMTNHTYWNLSGDFQESTVQQHSL